MTYSIQDNGIGIKPELVDKVFQIFYQANHDKENQGYGMGLAIVKKIVYKLNGEVELNSQHGQGSTILVSLPRGE